MSVRLCLDVLSVMEMVREHLFLSGFIAVDDDYFKDVVRRILVAIAENHVEV